MKTEREVLPDSCEVTKRVTGRRINRKKEEEAKDLKRIMVLS